MQHQTNHSLLCKPLFNTVNTNYVILFYHLSLFRQNSVNGEFSFFFLFLSKILKLSPRVKDMSLRVRFIDFISENMSLHS